MTLYWVGLAAMAGAMFFAVRGVRQRDALITELSEDVADLCQENAELRQELAQTWKGQKRDRKGRFGA